MILDGDEVTKNPIRTGIDSSNEFMDDLSKQGISHNTEVG